MARTVDIKQLGEYLFIIVAAEKSNSYSMLVSTRVVQQRRAVAVFSSRKRAHTKLTEADDDERTRRPSFKYHSKNCCW